MAKQTFESAMKQLEEIVKELETGDLPLEKALQRFEEGMKLSKFCASKLEETEKKVTRLIRDHQGMVMETPFVENASDPHDEPE
ncbi:MAG: exodeoxyribonuclease VII small subunit [Deltaproteobacteria bacterium]|nr:exodeoxyribonuclease VII small subunit [Deltaproteobacteria bacterium]